MTFHSTMFEFIMKTKSSMSKINILGLQMLTNLIHLEQFPIKTAKYKKGYFVLKNV
jgi:hypothetical protein